ncbi:MAG: hypothetical protein KAU24_04380 [Candidatus Aenigmarchaeota archaeon]|nr:hypothetical protein [Candidatus Aenigmarchaeota archaeon]
MGEAPLSVLVVGRLISSFYVLTILMEMVINIGKKSKQLGIIFIFGLKRINILKGFEFYAIIVI